MATAEKHVAELAVTWDETLAWRLRRHWLDRPVGPDVVAVARQLNGVQAQLMTSAELAICIRAESAQPADIQRANQEDRSLVKLWTVRGTLHLLPAVDLPLWIGALRTRSRHTRASWLRGFKITADEMSAILETVPRALAGRCLTRQELASEVGRLSGKPRLAELLRHSWGALLKPASSLGLLCYGPNDGQNVTFVAPREWLEHWEEIDSATALAEIARRYLDAYGPASHVDFARWFGVEARPARELFARLAPDLVAVDVEGEHGWLTPAGAAEIKAIAKDGVARLLPAFDPYVVGALRQLDALLPGPLRSRVSRAQGWISPTIMLDGRLVGVWRHELKQRRLQIAIEPFITLPRPVQTALEADAARLGTYVERPVAVTWLASERLTAPN